jgi:hypothetical protein
VKLTPNQEATMADDRPTLAKLNRPVTLWDIGWALFRYWEMKAQSDIPDEPTDSHLAELDPEDRTLVDAFPGVTADEAFDAFKALGFGLCRARGNLYPCLDRDVCCPIADWVYATDELPF